VQFEGAVIQRARPFLERSSVHRQLRSLLETAIGQSEFVLAIAIDVRGFTSFAGVADSSEAAIFLRRVCVRILDDFFPEHDFFKLTGDGLLILRRFDHETIDRVLGESLNSALQLVPEFPSLTKGDPMVNFATPANVGVGMARGAATALVSKSKILDYSGRPLNLATRLLDVARPSGVVFDHTLGPELLAADLIAQFQSADVYLRSIAEMTPERVYHTTDVEVEPRHLQPISKVEWHVEPTETLTRKQLAERTNFRHQLSQVPSDPNQVEVRFAYPATTKSGTKHPTMRRILTAKARYTDDAGTPTATLDYTRPTATMVAAGVKSTWKVSVTVRYPI
jgi:class 3 adenylate cyclase